jgi:hypothetical protein
MKQKVRIAKDCFIIEYYFSFNVLDLNEELIAVRKCPEMLRATSVVVRRTGLGCFWSHIWFQVGTCKRHCHFINANVSKNGTA